MPEAAPEIVADLVTTLGDRIVAVDFEACAGRSETYPIRELSLGQLPFISCGMATKLGLFEFDIKCNSSILTNCCYAPMADEEPMPWDKGTLAWAIGQDLADKFYWKWRNGLQPGAQTQTAARSLLSTTGINTIVTDFTAYDGRGFETIAGRELTIIDTDYYGAYLADRAGVGQKGEFFDTEKFFKTCVDARLIADYPVNENKHSAASDARHILDVLHKLVEVEKALSASA